MIKLILIAVGLSMDAFSVSVSYGACHKDARFYSAFRLAFFTGLFQFCMPLMGWLCGSVIGSYILKCSDYIAFLIFLIIGIKMIVDSVLKKEDCKPVDISKGRPLILISLATSIDALAAGFSIGLLNMSLLVAVSSIGIITFILSFSGVYLGKIAGFILGKWAEILGGVILILIALKILLRTSTLGI